MRAVLVVLAVLLAGCSTGGSPAYERDSSSTSPAAAIPASPLLNNSLNATTDTLYLLAAPDMAEASPENQTVLGVKGAYGAQTFSWNRTMNATGNLTGGFLRLWLLLPRSAVQQGAANDPGCTIHWIVVLVWNGTQQVLDGGCGSLGMGTIPPGEYDFNITAPPVPTGLLYGPGANLILQVEVGLVQPSGSPAYLLGGTSHYDSRLHLDGLAEPAGAAPRQSNTTRLL